MRACRLRTEYRKDPVGIGIRTPRLFWNCEGGTLQSAFEIEAEIDGKKWSTGKVSCSSMHWDWGSSAPALGSRACVRWRVRLWDETGKEGDWSEEAFFELGLLESADWSARWIRGDYRASRMRHDPADCFRKRFFAEHVRKARIYATACGMYELQINGVKVGDCELTPGACDFTKRVQAQTFDVTGMLREGENVLTAELAGGWYKSYLCSDARQAKYGCSTKLLVQLEMTDESGNLTVIGTDESWEWSNDGPVRSAENKMGEAIDAGKKAGYAGKAKVTSHPVPPLPSDNVPIRAQETFRPVLIRTPSGKSVLDFGQNIAGFVSFDLQAHAGQKIVLHMGELLEKGEFTQRNIDPDKKHRTPFQRVEYTCREGKNHYRTKFAIFGFQYVLIETDVPFCPEDFAAEAVYSDLEDTARFHSDNMLLNRFVEAARWSAKNNSADVPTDCPTRERVGWTGDAQIFAGTASFFFDWAAFGRKYLLDIRDSQHRNGSYTQCAPRCAMNRFMNVLDSSAGWADAGILIPYRLWKQYGDERIIREQYASMKRYGEFLIRRLGKKAANCKRPDISGGLQKYLVMTGLSYGEWLEPQEAVPFDVRSIAKPHVEESTAYTAYSLHLLSEMAQELGENSDAERFEGYASGCRKAYQALVRTPEYSLDTDRQAKLVRPLYMGLLDEEEEKYARKRLPGALEHFGWRVGTGFLSTPFLLYVLEEIGPEYAYRLLENRQMPGWLAMPENGAVTVWENWEGPLEENPASLDHYSKGAVCEWIFSRMCGIQIAGENLFRIAPVPGGSIRSASFCYQSVYGLAESSWERKEGMTKYRIRIPSGTAAEVIVPGREPEMLQAGEYEFQVPVRTVQDDLSTRSLHLSCPA